METATNESTDSGQLEEYLTPEESLPEQDPSNLERREDQAGRMGTAMIIGAIKGTLLAIPLGIAAMMLLVMAVGQPWNDGLATAWLPGVLVGVFFGGFAGVARHMDPH